MKLWKIRRFWHKVICMGEKDERAILELIALLEIRIMSLETQLKTSVDANTAAVTALVAVVQTPPVPSTPDTAVQAAITQIDANTAAANAAVPPAPAG